MYNANAIFRRLNDVFSNKNSNSFPEKKSMMRYTIEVKADIGSLVSVKNWAQIFYDVNKRCRISSQEGVTSLVLSHKT